MIITKPLNQHSFVSVLIRYIGRAGEHVPFRATPLCQALLTDGLNVTASSRAAALPERTT